MCEERRHWDSVCFVCTLQQPATTDFLAKIRIHQLGIVPAQISYIDSFKFWVEEAKNSVRKRKASVLINCTTRTPQSQHHFGTHGIPCGAPSAAGRILKMFGNWK